jgi:hypothetical protein
LGKKLLKRKIEKEENVNEKGRKGKIKREWKQKGRTNIKQKKLKAKNE